MSLQIFFIELFKLGKYDNQQIFHFDIYIQSIKKIFVSVLFSGVYFFNNLSSVLLGYFQFPLMIFNYIFQNLRAVSFIIVDKQTTCKISYIFPLIC